MADHYANAAQAGLRAALVADAGVSALVGARVVDDPAAGLALPYIRFGRITPRPDDTAATRGAFVLVGLEIHSRPASGRVEAQAIAGAIWAALHRRPEDITCAPFGVVEVECLTTSVDRAGDGATYAGTLAVELRLEE